MLSNKDRWNRSVIDEIQLHMSINIRYWHNIDRRLLGPEFGLGDNWLLSEERRYNFEALAIALC